MLFERVTSEFCKEEGRVTDNIQDHEGETFKPIGQNQNQVGFCCLVLKRGTKKRDVSVGH